jgi:lipopolysaccharide transport system ATP-binding protein
MGDVTQEGRTVLFVSHNMGAVRSLTSRSILLRNGEMAALGSTDEIIHTYLTESLEKGTQEHTDLSFFRRSNRDEGHVDFVGIRVEGEAVQEAGFPIGSELTVYMELAVHTAVRGVGFTIVIKNAEGTRVVVLASWDSGFTASFDPGRHTVRVSLGEIPLAPGQYFADVGVGVHGRFAYDVLADVPFSRIVNYDQVVHWPTRPWGVLHWDRPYWTS